MKLLHKLPLVFLSFFFLTAVMANQQKRREKKTISHTKAKQTSEKIYSIVDEMPSFPGGIVTMMQWIDQHIIYPPKAKQMKIEGRAFLSFVIEKNGSVSNIQVIRSANPILDKEAIRVLYSMPKWKAGKNKGIPVRVSYTVPVTFHLHPL